LIQEKVGAEKIPEKRVSKVEIQVGRKHDKYLNFTYKASDGLGK